MLVVREDGGVMLRDSMVNNNVDRVGKGGKRKG